MTHWINMLNESTKYFQLCGAQMLTTITVNSWRAFSHCLFFICIVKILWLKHQISNNKLITTMCNDKPLNGLWH